MPYDNDDARRRRRHRRRCPCVPESPVTGDGNLPKPALLYTATPDNPNFVMISIEDAANTIASAVGPSGPNSEYLFSLSEYLEKVW